MKNKMNSETVKRILIALICVVVIGASIGFGYFIASQSEGKETTTEPSETVNQTADSNDADDSSEDVTEDGAAQGGTNTGNDEKEAEQLLLGQWRDNANLSGYEFLEDGIMKVTYFNMSSLNLEDIIEGTYTGTYTVDGNKLTVSYTIYSKAVVNSYTFDVHDSILTLKAADGEEAVYIRKGAEPEKMENPDEELIGKWSSNLSGYEFKDTGVVTIKYIDLSSMGINLPISGTVDGVYTIDGNKLDIKFSIYTGVIEKKYTYSIEGKVLTLKDRESGETGTYIKESTAE